MRRVLGFVAMIGLLCAVSLAAEDTPGRRMFDRLRGLAGDWEGTLEWSQGRTGGGKLRATYYLTGHGSALVENLLMNGDTPSMTSVYHLDGADLRMTHFCAAWNQPRLKATHIDETKGSAEFSFVDVTNVSAANSGYVEGVFLQVVDADHVNLRFNFGGGPGKSGVETIVLKRVHPPAAHPSR